MSNAMEEQSGQWLATTLHTLKWIVASVVGVIFTHTGMPAYSATELIDRSSVRLGERTMSFDLHLESSTFYLLEVKQFGQDLLVLIDGPDDDRRTYNSPIPRDESEVVIIEPSTSGTYRVSLETQELAKPMGEPEVAVKALGSAGPEHQQAVGAWRLVRRAATEYAQMNVEEALQAYLEAARHWEVLGRSRQLASAYLSAAMIEYWDLFDWRSSEAHAHKAAQLYETSGEPKLAANARYLEALALIEQASGQVSSQAAATFEDAESVLGQAYDAQQRLDQRYEMGQIENIRGLVSFKRGRWTHAEATWRRCVEIFRGAGELGDELQSLQNLAVIDIERGSTEKAIKTLASIVRRLDAVPAATRSALKAHALSNLGAAFGVAGELDEALRAYQRSLEIYRSNSDQDGEVNSLRGRGATYYVFGQFSKAIADLDKALEIATKLKNRERQAAIKATMGNIAYQRGDHARALDLHESSVNLSDESKPNMAQRMVLVAKDLNALERYHEAIRRAGEARTVAVDVGAPVTEARAIMQAGISHAGLGEFVVARDMFDTARQMFESLGMPIDQADVLYNLALVAREQGDLETASRFGDEALRLLQKLRQRVSGFELRATFAAQRRRYFEFQTHLLMELQARQANVGNKFERVAFEMSERARARMMLDLLEQASVEVKMPVDDASLVNRQRMLEQLAALRLRRDEIVRIPGFSQQARERLNETVSQMRMIESRLDLLEMDLQRSSSGPTNSLTLSTEEVQRELDEDSMLIQYFLGESESRVWVVTSRSIASVKLADRATIEATAYEVFDGLRSRARDSSILSKLERDLTSLSALVIDPVAEYLDKPTLLIAADGGLQYIPFAALTLGDEEGRIIQNHQVVSVPSISAIAAQRRRAKSEAGRNAGVAVFADPIFDPEAKYPSLPATGDEARAIAALVPEQNRIIATGHQASRAKVLSQDLTPYRYLHFATHGEIDPQYPALSALVLSQLDRNGAPQNGFLRLHDIYRLRLNADLVVLSACETALGREIRGEGLVGLTQAFMYAGAQSLIVSLWQVPDQATSKLMTQFYRLVLIDGLQPAQALSIAQLSIASQGRWRSPQVWAAFTLLGEWQ